VEAGTEGDHLPAQVEDNPWWNLSPKDFEKALRPRRSSAWTAPRALTSRAIPSPPWIQCPIPLEARVKGVTGSQRMKINNLTVDFQPSLSPQDQGSGEWGWVTLIR